MTSSSSKTNPKSNPELSSPSPPRSDPMLSNTSPHDVFPPLAVLAPSFKENVVPEAMSAVLGEGDVLFFPPGWWHAMRAESASFSVSMWF